MIRRDDIIAEIAKQHGVLLPPDDPILMIATMLDLAALTPVIDDEDIRRLSDAAARGAERRAAELARTHQWRLLLAVAAFVTVLAGAAASAGYWAAGGFNTTCWTQSGGVACGYWFTAPIKQEPRK